MKCTDLSRFFIASQKPLMIASTSAELLLLSPNLSTKERNRVEQIEDACRRMNGLISTFLDICRNDTDVNSRNSIDIREFFRNAESDWRKLSNTKPNPIEIRLDLSQAGEQSYNRYLLDSVFNNLVRNAINYTESGSVTITVKADEVIVADTGPGIAPEDRERIFEHGYRGQSAGSAKGFGFGLTVAKRICDYLGWQISLTSQKDKGTVVTVKLPK